MRCPSRKLLVSPMPVRLQREFSIGLDVADGQGIDAGAAGLLTPKNVTEYVPELVNFFDSIVVERRGTDEALSRLIPRCFINRGVYMWPSRMPIPRSDIVSVTSDGATFGRLEQSVGTRSARQVESSMPYTVAAAACRTRTSPKRVSLHTRVWLSWRGQGSPAGIRALYFPLRGRGWPRAFQDS
jgi:hypothetical protein